MSQTPPNHYCPTPEGEREPYQTYALIPECPWCGTDLELHNRVTWIRYCPECPYSWVSRRVEP